MTRKERIMKELLSLSKQEREQILAFFGYKPKPVRRKKRLKKDDPMLDPNYHLEILKKRFPNGFK